MPLNAELFVNLASSLLQDMDKRLLMSQPVENELEKFNSYYQNSIYSPNPEIQRVIDHTLSSGGKKIRPILLLLAAKACGEINEVTYNTAVTVELLHTASLIHDDVVDESMLRRGKPSLNAVYDNKMAVLAGDYFLSTALIKSVLTGNMEIVTIISDLGRNLAEGELNQLFLAKNVILNENEYFEVIKKKTASLLSVCMKVGAISVNASMADVEKFTQIGEYLGVCFQLRDDIFDYYDNNVGKPTGNDIREGKVTLPLLYSLRNAPEEVANSLLEIINKADFTDENVNKLTSYAKENGGIDYAYRKMDDYKTEALKIIDTLTDSDVKKALYSGIDYVVERAF